MARRLGVGSWAQKTMGCGGWGYGQALAWEQGTSSPLHGCVAWVKPCLSLCCLLQGTMVITNLTALHRDPEEWATPNTFNPEHFLENGQLKKRDAFLPFSIGEFYKIRGCGSRTPLHPPLLLSPSSFALAGMPPNSPAQRDFLLQLRIPRAGVAPGCPFFLSPCLAGRAAWRFQLHSVLSPGTQTLPLAHKKRLGICHLHRISKGHPFTQN